MKVKFYGTRGSIPVCNKEFHEFGGNTTCIKVEDSITGDIAIIDAGTGIRDLGKDLKAAGLSQSEDFFIAFTHFHWDHIQGFPFFGPAYNNQQKIHLISMGDDHEIEDIKEIFEVPLQVRYFPVQLENMGASFEFIQPDTLRNDFPIKITESYRHSHPGGAYSFRIETNNKVLVICTDVEHGDGIDPNIVALARGADLLIHDGQYTPDELKLCKGWGHSSYVQAIEVAELAGVKQLAITHHDPDHDDAFLNQIEEISKRRFPNCFLAREKMEVRL